VGTYTSGNWSLLNTMRRHVLPQAPSPTITNFFLMAAMNPKIQKSIRGMYSDSEIEKSS